MDIRNRVIYESNEYFERNKHLYDKEGEASPGTCIAGAFLKKIKDECPESISNVLEIGCNYGYNLKYLSSILNYQIRIEGGGGINAYGIDTSDKAIDFGRKKWNDDSDNIHLLQACSNDLPFCDNQFDVVMIGFCLYITPREWISSSLLEIHRVLKNGGFLIITDFDTPVWYKRINKHNEEMSVYKEDYSKRFMDFGYTLIEKHTYSHDSDFFPRDVQERVSTQILYKESPDDLYFLA